MNSIMNEKRRIIERCSTSNRSLKHLEEFLSTIQKNDRSTYGMNLMPPPKNRAKRSIGNETFFIHLPFICDGIDRSIRRAFKKAKLPVIPYYRNNNLRRLLSTKKPHDPCNLRECPLKHPKLCTRKGVVYCIKGNICESKYIGSSIKPLHQRLKEHINNRQSAVLQHLQNCADNSNNITVNFLSQDRDPKNLRVKVALLIAEENPPINRKDEEINVIQNFNFHFLT
jgi:hypothetical protein